MLRLAAYVMASLLFLGVARAEDDPLEQGRDLIEGPEDARGRELLEGVLKLGAADGADATTLLRAGRAAWYLRYDDRARAYLDKAKALEPKQVAIAYWEGLVWREADAERARAAFERAVEQDPKHGGAWLELGQIHSAAERDAEALKAFEQAVALRPNDERAHFLVAVALDHFDRDADALPHLKRAVELKPDYVNAGYNLGLNHFRGGRYAEARDAWVGMAVHAPDDLMLHAKIVQAFHALDRPVDAAAWRKKVLAIQAEGRDEDAKGRKEWCFEQFRVDGLEVLAYERFPAKSILPIELIYVYYVRKDGKETQRVQLELSQIAKELGAPAYVLGAQVGDEHRTFDLVWQDPPAVVDLRRSVVQAIRGELKVASSSTRGSVKVNPR